MSRTDDEQHLVPSTPSGPAIPASSDPSTHYEPEEKQVKEENPPGSGTKTGQEAEAKKPGETKQTKEPEPFLDEDGHEKDRQYEKTNLQKITSDKEPGNSSPRRFETPDGKMHYQCMDCGGDVALGPDDEVECPCSSCGYRVVQKYRRYDQMESVVF